jgi:tetratricopeptide (TPR) repeat protein
MEMLAKMYLAKNSYDKALAVANDMKATFEEDAVGDFYIGLVRQQQGNAEAAINAYKTALDKSPDVIEPLSAMLRVFLGKGDYAKAVAQLDELLQKKPDNVVLLNMKGEALLAGKKVSEAKEMFRAAIKVKPDYIFPYRNLAAAELDVGNTDKAIAIYKKGVEATNGSPRLSFPLASLYERVGKAELAMGQYELVYNNNPKSLAAANNWAMLLVTHKDDEQSLSKAKDLVAPLEDSENPAYLDTIGWVYYKTGEYDQAIAMLEKAVNTLPNEPLLHYHLGMAYFSSGNETAAHKNLEIAVNGDRNFRGKDEAKVTLDELKNRT